MLNARHAWGYRLLRHQPRPFFFSLAPVLEVAADRTRYLIRPRPHAMMGHTSTHTYTGAFLFRFSMTESDTRHIHMIDDQPHSREPLQCVVVISGGSSPFGRPCQPDLDIEAKPRRVRRIEHSTDHVYTPQLLMRLPHIATFNGFQILGFLSSYCLLWKNTKDALSLPQKYQGLRERGSQSRRPNPVSTRNSTG
jgi:hypothetical protein